MDAGRDRANGVNRLEDIDLRKGIPASCTNSFDDGVTPVTYNPGDGAVRSAADPVP